VGYALDGAPGGGEKGKRGTLFRGGVAARAIACAGSRSLLAALGQGACCCCCRMMATRASLLGGSTPLSGCIEASEAWFWLAELGRLGRLEVAERGRWMGQGSAAGAGSVLGEAQGSGAAPGADAACSW